ncbi:ISL3 family transposase [Faecalibacillus intestinalis]
MILNEMKNIDITTSDVAARYNVLDTTGHYIFLQYLDIQRLPLPEVLSIDEVHLDIDYRHKYALVMMDFTTYDIIDILPNRWEETTNPYFLSIPEEERAKVKYLICDMYNPYINYTKRYFPNSIAIIDSFHVVSWLIHKIIIYLNMLKKSFLERDRKAFEEKLIKENKPHDYLYINKNLPFSKEVYLLNHYRWLLPQNKDNIDYKTERKYNHKFKMYLNTYDYERMFFEIDDSLIKIRVLKEKYIQFNATDERDKKKIADAFSKLIEEYSESEFSFIGEFAETLKRHKQEIINSFTYIIDGEGKERRLSNGPIEGFNRVPKDFKRHSRGLSNFDYARSRLIWSNRKNEPVLATPKSKIEVYKFKKNK